MHDSLRYRLLHGPYVPPRFRIGQRVFCKVRGWVTICDISSGRLPWPIGKKIRARSLVIYLGLEKAIRRESAIAICHWWGVTPQTVTVWRKALGVPEITKGTSALRSEYAREDWAIEARKLAHSKAQDPARREKIAAGRRGIPRPPAVIAKLRAANLGKKLSEETKRRMSLAHRKQR